MLNPWRWEPIDALFGLARVTLNKAGPLLTPAHAMKIQRNERRELRLVLFLDMDASTSVEPLPPGTVHPADGQVDFTSERGFSGVIDGVVAGSTSRTTNAKLRTTSLTQEAICSQVKVEIAGDGVPKHTIEWIDNFQAGSFMWSGSVVEETTDRSTVTFGRGEKAIVLGNNGKDFSSRFTGVELSIGGWELYLADTDCSYPGVRAPGCIVYRGAPNEAVRRKIRDCLSFALGHHLVYLGNATLDETDNLKSVLLVDGSIMEERVFDLPPMPPAPLWVRYQREVDPARLSRLVNGLYQQSETLNFQRLSWQYWHAAVAPAHAAAAHFGAVVEALREAYKDAYSTQFRTRIISDKVKWEQLRKKLLDAVDASLLGEETDIALIKNKLNNLNAMPPSRVSEQVFGMLGLEVSTTEQGAWKGRNAAAHGGSVAGDTVNTIKNVKLLRILFHRLLLKMTNGSDAYCDYHTVGHPTRKLEEPVP